MDLSHVSEFLSEWKKEIEGTNRPATEEIKSRSSEPIYSDSGRSTCGNKYSHNLTVDLAMNRKHKPLVNGLSPEP